MELHYILMEFSNDKVAIPRLLFNIEVNHKIALNFFFAANFLVIFLTEIVQDRIEYFHL